MRVAVNALVSKDLFAIRSHTGNSATGDNKRDDPTAAAVEDGEDRQTKTGLPIVSSTGASK